jgi:hypothetical protein
LVPVTHGAVNAQSAFFESVPLWPVSPHIRETAKLMPLLGIPPTVMTTYPEVAPLGTVVAMLVWLQLATVAAVPLNVTVLLPWVEPKFVPVIATAVPAGPAFGDRAVTVGATVKFMPLLATPPTVTTTLPVVAPVGTVVAMLVVLQLVTVAAVPLNATVLLPWLDPKFAPDIVTAAPIAPDVGFRPVIVGVGNEVVIVKPRPLLATPPTVTTTLPVVAPVGTFVAMLVVLQLVTVAAVPLNVTALLPCVGPKFVPVIVTAVPTGPEVGFRFVIVGVDTVTVKLTPLLAVPPTVTTTFPVVAPLGTAVAMLVVLQLVTVAAVPLNVTVLAPCADPKFVPVIVTAVPAGPEVGLTLVIWGPTAAVRRP